MGQSQSNNFEFNFDSYNERPSEPQGPVQFDFTTGQPRPAEKQQQRAPLQVRSAYSQPKYDVYGADPRDDSPKGAQQNTTGQFDFDFNGGGNENRPPAEDLLMEVKPNADPSGFDFDAIPTYRPDEGLQIPMSDDLLETEEAMSAPRGEPDNNGAAMVFDFDTAGVKEAEQPTQSNAEPDLLNSLDNGQTAEDIILADDKRKAQEKTDKIQEFLNKQFTVLDNAQKEREEKEKAERE